MMLKKSLYQLKSKIMPPKNVLSSTFPRLRNLCLEGTDREWKQLLYYNEMLNLIHTVPGDIAEFGVAGGVSILTLHRLKMINERGLDSKERRKIFGFDSFQGLPKLHETDLNKKVTNDQMKEGGFFEPDSYESLFNYSNMKTDLHLIKGWFNETLPVFLKENPDVSFALIHVDCDLYKSTLEVLENVYPRVVPGGVIIFDELFHKDFPGETLAFREFFQNKNLKLIRSEVKPDKKILIKCEV